MPLAPANPATDEEDDDLPTAPKPRIGSTGGVIPEQQSEIDARTPVKWQEDPMLRQEQVNTEIAKRRQAQFQKEHPFTPSGWQQKITTPETRREDREFEGNAEAQFQYQQQTAREAEVGRRKGEIAQRNARNNQLEAQYRGSGQKFYTDADGQIQQVIETESGRPLYEASGWEVGTHPKTGKPTMSMRDKYGQRQFKEPPVVPSLDPMDDQMHYKLPDGTTVAAGSIDDFAKSPNYTIAKAALSAKTRQVKAVHQEALQPIRLMADQAVAQLEDAKVEIAGLDAEIENLSLKVANSTGPDGSPTPLSEGLGASLAQLQAKRDKLDGMIKPRGELAQRAARAKAGFAIASATAMREAFLSQQAEIVARVKAAGGNPEADPTYQANLRGLRSAEQILGQGEQQMGAKPTPTAAVPATGPGSNAPAGGAAPAESAGPLEQSEPYVASQNGVKNVGSVKMEEFARRYGDGRGPVQPAAMLKLDRRSKEIAATLENDETSLNQTMRDQMTQEKEYIDSLFKQRFAKLSPEQQERVTNATTTPGTIMGTVGSFRRGIRQGENIVDAASLAGAAAVRESAAGEAGIVAEEQVADRAPDPKNWQPGGSGIGGERGYQRAVEKFNERQRLRGDRVEGAKRAVEGVTKQVIPQLAKNIARRAKEIDDIPQAAGKVGYDNAKGIIESLAAVGSHPIDTVLGLAAESLPASSASLAAGAAGSAFGPGGTAAGVGMGSFATEVGSTIMSELQKQGANFDQPETVDAILSDPKKMEAIYQKAVKRGVPVAIMDALSAGVAGRFLRVGKGVGGKAISVAGEAAVQAGTGAAGELGGQLAAGDKVDWKDVLSEALGELGPGAGEVITGAVRDKISGVGGEKAVATTTPPPTGGTPAKPAAPAPPAAPAQTSRQAAEAEFQKRLAEDATPAAETPAPPETKSAAESAEIFAKTATKKSAAESAEAFEAYQKDPIGVDPDRRIKELNAELEKLDADWKAHVEKVGAEAVDVPRKQALDDRRAAIESELAKAEELRQSDEGAAGLKAQLTAEEQASAEAARKLPTEELTGRRDAIEEQLSEAERVRQSNKGGADLKNDLAAKSGKPTEPAPVKRPSGSVVEQVSAMTGEQFGAWEQENGGQTGASNKLGISMIGKPDEIAALKKAGEAAKAEWKAAFEKAKAAGPGGDVAAENTMQRLASKEQFFAEAISAAEGTGSGLQDPEVVAAHAPKPTTRTGKEVVEDIIAKNPHADKIATKMLVGKKNYEVRDVPISEIGEVFGSKTVQPDVVKKYEATKSEDPIVLGRVAGSTDKSLRAIDGKHRLTAAKNRGDKTIKAYVPVEAKVETKAETKPASAEAKPSAPAPVAETKSEAAPPVKTGEPPAKPTEANDEVKVDEIKPPKDAAPISKDIEQHTPETVEGDKINKNWTAFGPESGTLGIPRAEMPQIKSEHRGALVNFLQARGIKTKRAMVRPGDLKPTQAEFSPAKVDKARSFEGSERPVLISADGHLVDGHHQWMAGLQDDPSTPMPVIKLEAPIDKVLAEMKEFPSTETAVGVAAKAATKEPSISAPATKRLSDRAIEALQKAKIDTKGKLFDVTGAAAVAAYNGAIDLAILGIRAGRAVNDVVKLAITRYKAKHPSHTAEDVSRLETDIRTAIETQPPEPEPGTAKSNVPESLRDVGTPAKDIEYDVRAQNERMAEARAAISSKGARQAEQMISDRELPADTRVAIGGVLLEHKMTQLANAKPEEVEQITRDIQRITEATRSGVSTESGQGVAMHNKIYENLAVGAAMEYTKEVTKQRDVQMGGKETTDAAGEAAEAFNKTAKKEDRDAAIDKLKEKYTTKPARRMLDQLKRIEVVKDLNKLGVLTREDMVNVAGNAIGIPGISAKKLKHIADLAGQITNAKDHATRSKAELKLADTLHIYKGVNPLDLEASMLTLNILSGPSTQLANLEGNALNLIAQLGTTAMVNPTKLGSIMKGVMEGIPLGVDQAKSILATGRGTKDFQDRTLGSSNALQNVDYARDFPKLNKTAGDVLTARARVIEKISRFMKAADAVFYYPAREAYARLVTTKLLEGKFQGAELSQKVSEALHTTVESFESAKKQATAEGYEGIDLSRRVSDIIEERRSKGDVGKQAVKESERFAAEATFNNEPVGLAGVIYRNLARTVKDADIGGVPVLKPWAMFLRVPANVFNATTNFTPMGSIRAELGVKGEKYRKGGTGENQWRNFTKDERARLHMQSIIGTTLMAALTASILQDDEKKRVKISAAGPLDPNKRAQWKAGGGNPYSIQIGDRSISYKDSPLLVPLAIVGHVADAVRFQKSKSDMVLGNRVVDAVSHAPQIIFQTSMLSGLSELMSALGGQGDIMKSLERTLGSIPANLAIPYNRLLQQVDQSFDEKVYKENPAVDAIPFVRREGEMQTDVQGRPRTFSPMSRFTTEQSKDPVDSILREKNIFIPEAGKDSKIGNRAMTDEEHTKYRRISGQRIRARIQLIAPQLRSMNQEQAQKRVEQISREERDKVRPLIGSGVAR